MDKVNSQTNLHLFYNDTQSGLQLRAGQSLIDHDLIVEGTFFSNELGQITGLKAKRYGDGKLQEWIGQYHDY